MKRKNNNSAAYLAEELRLICCGLLKFCWSTFCFIHQHSNRVSPSVFISSSQNRRHFHLIRTVIMHGVLLTLCWLRWMSISSDKSFTVEHGGSYCSVCWCKITVLRISDFWKYSWFKKKKKKISSTLLLLTMFHQKSQQYSITAPKLMVKPKAYEPQWHHMKKWLLIYIYAHLSHCDFMLNSRHIESEQLGSIT